MAVAHLENDPEAHHERLIVEALKEFEEVEVLRFDRTITLRGSQPEESVRAGHEQARKLLHKSGAHVLIWGTVLHHEGTSLPKLYWTALKSPSPGLREQRYRWTDHLDLPALFWEDLVIVLRLSVATERAEFAAQEGQYIADRLGPFIQRVRTLLASGGQRKGWTPQGVAEVQFVLGNSLSTIGEQTGSREPLEEAVTAYQEALKEYTRERVPLNWAATQNNLGNALQTLGERESGTERLEKAVAAYREALKERTRERVPLQWAATQNNLGRALREIGGRKRDARLVCEALRCFLAGREVFKDSAPYHASVTSANIKKALSLLKQEFPSSEYESCKSVGQVDDLP